MTKTVLSREDLIAIDGARGNIPADWVKIKYKIGTRRLNNLWNRDLTLQKGSEVWVSASDKCDKKSRGRPKGTKNPDKLWAKENNWIKTN